MSIDQSNVDSLAETNVNNLAFLEGQLTAFKRDRLSVGSDWQKLFEKSQGDSGDSPMDEQSRPHRSAFARRHRNGRARPKLGRNGIAVSQQVQTKARQERVDQLIENYRIRGHMAAQLDPLGRKRPRPPELDLEYYGFTPADLDLKFSMHTREGANLQTLREIIHCLQETYCRSIGVQFTHIEDLEVRTWLQSRMESCANRIELTGEQQLRIFRQLNDAVVFEEFLQKKFLGAKSFSLEGSESLIPLLDTAIEQASADGVTEIVFGMAHRGRLNVLANVLGKSPRLIFREFADVDPELHLGRGDVKYHLGYTSNWTTVSGEKVRLVLCFNPSHLEFVNPVAMGRMRARMDRDNDAEHRRGLTILIHGDAAFAAEGVVQESLNMSELSGYTSGGTLHVIVNNQLGFTTPPEEGRSSVYCTDVAKMLQSPIFHVNGEDPEAVTQVVNLAMEFRREFQRDVFIDMYCYRLVGHNEADEPTFTQPVMYRQIKDAPLIRDSYLEHLLKSEGITREEADRITQESYDRLETLLERTTHGDEKSADQASEDVKGEYKSGREPKQAEVDTQVDRERLEHLLARQTELPENFHPHPKIERSIKRRRSMAAGNLPLDWSAAESLAFATLATDGIRIRLTGQDSARGTFSQRHAVLHDYENGDTFVPLQHLSEDQAAVEILNSPLSENGVMGFEYGYSLDYPEALVIWEAQFGDFVNAGQVIVDQFIASGADKWNQLSGLVLLLPHGFEGQGPEHSSARLERFLQLGAEDNLLITQPSTAAQYFHLLRRQVLRKWRQPLVVMTPKALLRSRDASSSLDELANGRFQRMIDDIDRPQEQRIKRILMCSGKLFYDLQKKRKELGRDDVSIVRLEQFYPFPDVELKSILARAPEGTPITWVQEEPENMGAWRYLRIHLGEQLPGRHRLTGVSRPASASPATGSKRSHEVEQEELIAQAFASG